ncbi:MAG: phage holin family protein [Synergistaceae bacterium]|nr:phage holin family protein [Synergistaceae bacterium]MBQ3653606.1 phage holin family protein [Synergistaceae bacterium]
MDDYIDLGFGVFGGVLSWFIGGLDGALKILVAMMIADYITGLMKGYIHGGLSSSEGFHGIAKKVCMFLFVGVANIIDNELLGRSEVLRDAVIFFYIANEGLSITENAIDIGLPVPDSVKGKFKEWVHKDSELAQTDSDRQHPQEER